MYMYIHINRYTDILIHIYRSMHPYIYTSIYLSIYLYIYRRICIHSYVYIYIYMYTHLNKHMCDTYLRKYIRIYSEPLASQHTDRRTKQTVHPSFVLYLPTCMHSHICHQTKPKTLQLQPRRTAGDRGRRTTSLTS